MDTTPNSTAGAGSDAAWTRLVDGTQVEALHEVAGHLRRAGVDVLLGGAFAIGRHVGRWRGTKDVDFFLHPRDREAAVAALVAAGFADYHGQLAYDRSWIFRGVRGEALVDLIWTVPNHVTEVDDAWFEHAAAFSLQGRSYATLPIEELIWIKLFVLQRDRCDWPDVINLVRTNAASIDWERLLTCLGDHEPLLGAVLQVVEWLSPAEIAQLPDWVRSRFHLRERTQPLDPAEEMRRVALLDSRAWYAALVPATELMKP